MEEDQVAEYQIIIDGETVHGVFQGDAGLAKLLEQVLNQVLEAQVSEQLGAERYERSEERQGYRNGVRPRKLTTRVGQLTLRVPQVRDGQFSPELFARYQRSEQALVLALMEMVVNGVSTRKVTAITEERCGMRDELLQVDRLGAVRPPRSAGHRLERAPAGRAGLPVCAR
jgi:transposase-like protein